MNVCLCVLTGLQKRHQGQLTSLVVSDAKVRWGQVDIHVMLEDLLEEALPLSQLELLCRVHIWEPLATLGLRWQSQQKDQELDSSSDKVSYLMTAD